MKEVQDQLKSSTKGSIIPDYFLSDSLLQRSHTIAASAAHAEAKVALKNPQHMHKLLRAISALYEPIRTLNRKNRNAVASGYRTMCMKTITALLRRDQFQAKFDPRQLDRSDQVQ